MLQDTVGLLVYERCLTESISYCPQNFFLLQVIHFFNFYVVIHTFDYETRLHVLLEILYEYNLSVAALALLFLFNALVLVLYPKNLLYLVSYSWLVFHAFPKFPWCLVLTPIILCV